ncbi:histidine kinase [Streptomyces sp. S.PB5]|uniref:sensor histidine kinase n=1 Tax=Streptomyces sp. S.PB5 TaxID=3020844 RepID=UPI0025B076C2|nr:histidine kinase [Streptomyces sp. S.PB5]MDN3026406.1 histidine kinase [Streptomyces sp. S.PB5]
MDNGAGLTSFRRYTWWAVPGTVVCVLVLAYGSWALDGDVPLWARAPVVPALGVHAVAAAVLLGGAMADGRSSLRPLAGWVVTACLASAVLAVLPLVRHNYGLWAVAPAVTVAIVAAYLSAGGRRWLIGGAVVLALIPGSVVHLSSRDGELAYAALFPACLTAFTVWTVLGPLWAWRIAGRLDRARRLEAELAVKDERLRFASDLHDIQGHHLQVIALKAELASRLAEIDPPRAAAEMREIRQLCADALRDTRAVVQGMRRTNLDDEIANATRVLAAAGIDARMNLEPGALAAGLADSTRQLLGLVMREATTNVLRHSQAAGTEVDYRVTGDRARLRIANDGAEPAPGTPGAPGTTGTADGTGLRGLAERLRDAGGELTWERADGDRFVVTATLPVEGNTP